MLPVQMTEPEFRALLEFWLERCDGPALPTRRMLDPVALFPLLPILSLVEVIDGGADFRVRIAASEIEDRHGACLRGRSIADIGMDVGGADTSGQWRLAAERRRPFYRRGPIRLPRNLHFDYARLILPISADGQDRQTPAFLLAGSIMDPATRKDFERDGTVSFELDEETVQSIFG